MQERCGILVITTLLISATVIATPLSGPGTSAWTIKQTNEECKEKCVSDCANGGVPNICLMYCLHCCTHPCPLPNHDQRLSPSSASYYCNAGCSLQLCSKIEDAEEKGRCIGECTSNYCKI